MAAVIVNPDKVREFKNADHFYVWLGKHHAKEDELWIKIHKLDSGLTSITPKEAIDVVLCWGWIDGVKKSLDNKSYLHRYTPRREVGRLIKEGRMTEHGLKAVEAAKSDGRWDRAYGSGKDMKIPDELQAAIEANPQAGRRLRLLSKCWSAAKQSTCRGINDYCFRSLARRSRKAASALVMALV